MRVVGLNEWGWWGCGARVVLWGATGRLSRVPNQNFLAIWLLFRQVSKAIPSSRGPKKSSRKSFYEAKIVLYVRHHATFTP